MKRKCRRVYELTEYFGEGGGCALGMYIPIFTLEDACNEEWIDLVRDLRNQVQLTSFCISLKVDENRIALL